MLKTLLVLAIAISVCDCTKNKTQINSVQIKGTKFFYHHDDFYQKWKFSKIMDTNTQLNKNDELRQKLINEIEEEEMKRKYEEEMKRKNIFEKHLLPFHIGSSFLRDFHTRRF